MSGVVGVDDACGSGVVGVVVTRPLLALLAECSHCRWTTVEYDPHWTMHASWDPDVALMRSRSGSRAASSRLCIAGRAAAAYLYKVEYELDLVPLAYCCTSCRAVSVQMHMS